MENPLKKIHENFTKQVGQSTVTEITALSLLPFLLLEFRSFVLQFVGPSYPRLSKSLLWDYVLVLFPIIASLTIANRFSLILWSSLAMLALSMRLINLFFQRSVSVTSVHFDHGAVRKNGSFVVMILTCLMICGIDFSICPRRFAKTHTYGLGLMDVGTGLAIGISTFGLSSRLLQPDVKRNRGLYPAIRALLLLLAIGVLRCSLVLLLDYQQPPEEYGLHWNFFFTLVGVRFFSLLLIGIPMYFTILPFKGMWRNVTFVLFIAFGFLVCSLLLEHHVNHFVTDRGEWPTMEDRSRSIVLANIEGLVSIPGYTSIYLFALALNMMHERFFSRSCHALKHFLPPIILGLFVLTSCGFYFNTYGFSFVSRRFANSGYVIFMVWLYYVSYTFGALLYCSPFRTDHFSSPLVDCIYSQPFTYFLLSNVATGAVNLLANTKRFIPIGTDPDPITGEFSLELSTICPQLLIFTLYSVGCVFLIHLYSSKKL